MKTIKYTEEFRREVVNTAKTEGINTAAAKYGVSSSSVHGWIGAEKKGRLGNPSTSTKQTRKNNHKVELRRSVLAYAAAHTKQAAATHFGVCLSSIHNWVKAEKEGRLEHPISKSRDYTADTRATIAEDAGVVKQLVKTKKNTPARGTAPAAMLDFFEGKKACCVECGEANSGGFRGFISRNAERKLTDFHCISCGAVLTDSLLSHYEQNK